MSASRLTRLSGTLFFSNARLNAAILPSRVLKRGRAAVDCTEEVEAVISWAGDKAESVCSLLMLRFSAAVLGEATDKVPTLSIICIASSLKDVLLCSLDMFGYEADDWYMYWTRIDQKKRIVIGINMRDVFRGEIQRGEWLNLLFYRAKTVMK